jgi:hypothetical protein
LTIARSAVVALLALTAVAQAVPIKASGVSAD